MSTLLPLRTARSVVCFLAQRKVAGQPLFSPGWPSRRPAPLWPNSPLPSESSHSWRPSPVAPNLRPRRPTRRQPRPSHRPSRVAPTNRGSPVGPPFRRTLRSSSAHTPLVGTQLSAETPRSTSACREVASSVQCQLPRRRHTSSAGLIDGSATLRDFRRRPDHRVRPVSRSSRRWRCRAIAASGPSVVGTSGDKASLASGKVHPWRIR